MLRPKALDVTQSTSHAIVNWQVFDIIRSLAKKHNARHILDYGCGKCDLWQALHKEIEVHNFDPALPGLDARPEPADVVACIDVLEHVEPEYLDNVLTDLARVTLRTALITIATRPALKLLADGTNPHRILEDSRWWVNRLKQCFQIADAEVQSSGTAVKVIVELQTGGD